MIDAHVDSLVIESSRAIDVGVVVVTHNSADHIDDLVDSLHAGLDGLSWSVVVVDNASPDDTVQRLRDRDMAVIEMGRNAGYAAALNAGRRHFAAARSVLFMNPDIKLERGSVAKMLAELRRPSVGIVAPQTRDFEGTLSWSLRRDPSIPRAFAVALVGGTRAMRFGSFSEFVADEQTYLTPHDADWVVGAIMLVSRDCLDAVGEWDESYFLYSEETDFCLRTRHAGFAVRYLPSAVAYHEGGGGVHQPRLRSMMVVNKVRLYARSHSRVASWIFYIGVLLNERIRAAAGNDAARAAASALMHPKQRPPEIRCSASLLPH